MASCKAQALEWPHRKMTAMPIDYDDMMQSGATGLDARYDEKDVMLYALGVGFMRDPLDDKELPFVYEKTG